MIIRIMTVIINLIVSVFIISDFVIKNFISKPNFVIYQIGGGSI